jgi:hypothetical protein
MVWWSGSNGRASAEQAPGSEFNPSTIKNKKIIVKIDAI